MDSVGQESFDHRKYMTEYKKKMKKSVRAAMDEDVHYGNIMTVPRTVSGISHTTSRNQVTICARTTW